MLACTLCHNRKVSADFNMKKLGLNGQTLLGQGRQAQFWVLADMTFIPKRAADFLQVRCEVDVDPNTCVTCKTAGVECMWATLIKLLSASVG